MSTLHIVNKSPRSSDALRRCLALARQGDSVLLIEDGVYAAHRADNRDNTPQTGLHWYALDNDLQARGIQQLAPDIERIGYDRFVALVCACHNSVSWT